MESAKGKDRGTERNGKREKKRYEEGTGGGIKVVREIWKKRNEGER